MGSMEGGRRGGREGGRDTLSGMPEMRRGTVSAVARSMLLVYMARLISSHLKGREGGREGGAGEDILSVRTRDGRTEGGREEGREDTYRFGERDGSQGQALFIHLMFVKKTREC